MTLKEIINKCQQSIDARGFIDLDNDIYKCIDADAAGAIAREFGNSATVLIPEKELRFFEHLRSADEAVWHDLWADSGETVYRVGAAYMPLLIEPRRGFPICDLVSCDNYYFTKEHLIGEESMVMLETARNQFHARKPLSLAQWLVLEVSTDPIDIWRFAYLFNISVQVGKNVVSRLVEDNAIIHLTDSGHLAPFVRI